MAKGGQRGRPRKQPPQAQPASSAKATNQSEMRQGQLQEVAQQQPPGEAQISMVRNKQTLIRFSDQIETPEHAGQASATARSDQERPWEEVPADNLGLQPSPLYTQPISQTEQILQQPPLFPTHGADPEG